MGSSNGVTPNSIWGKGLNMAFQQAKQQPHWPGRTPTPPITPPYTPVNREPVPDPADGITPPYTPVPRQPVPGWGGARPLDNGPWSPGYKQNGIYGE